MHTQFTLTKEASKRRAANVEYRLKEIRERELDQEWNLDSQQLVWCTYLGNHIRGTSKPSYIVTDPLIDKDGNYKDTKNKLAHIGTVFSSDEITIL
jgi:hypothetical protein